MDARLNDCERVFISPYCENVRPGGLVVLRKCDGVVIYLNYLPYMPEFERIRESVRVWESDKSQNVLLFDLN